MLHYVVLFMQGYIVVSNPAVREKSAQPMQGLTAPTAIAVLPSVVTVKVSVANLRDGPAVHGKVVVTVKQGTKLSVLGEENGWFFVQTADAKEGWLSKSLTMQ